MEKKLTPAQAMELDKALPEYFKQLDSEFHHRAEKLRMAAANHDPELAAFQYYRLVETCALCHSAYAKTRFPGFSPTAQQDLIAWYLVAVLDPFTHFLPPGLKDWKSKFTHAESVVVRRVPANECPALPAAPHTTATQKAY